jgi:hypothetical protein
MKVPVEPHPGQRMFVDVIQSGGVMTAQVDGPFASILSPPKW